MIPTEEEVAEFIRSIGRISLGKGYTAQDRARDFVATFASDSGQRVLAMIASFCSPRATPQHADQPGMLAYKEGQRSIMEKIMACFVAPQAEPSQQTKEGEDAKPLG